MNETETLKILASIQAMYPNCRYGEMGCDEYAAVCGMWHRAFVATPYESVYGALAAFIATDTKGFPPMPGQLNGLLRLAGGLSEQDAWNLVRKAVSNSRYNAGEEFGKLPAIVRRAVGSHKALEEWADIDTDELSTVIRSHFVRGYRELRESAAVMDALPESMRATLPVDERVGKVVAQIGTGSGEGG